MILFCDVIFSQTPNSANMCEGWGGGGGGGGAGLRLMWVNPFWSLMSVVRYVRRADERTSGAPLSVNTKTNHSLSKIFMLE